MADLATRSLPQAPGTQWLQHCRRRMRLVLHGEVAARKAATAVWGVEFAEQACRAMQARCARDAVAGPR